MNEDALISAEAIVTSKRPNHVSMFSADLDTLSVDPKRFYANPAFVKEAVQRFKKDGFSVASVDRFGLSIIGTKALFESTFKITFVIPSSGGDARQDSVPPVLVAGDPPTDFINPQQSDYRHLLDGVTISSQPRPMMPGGNDEELPILEPIPEIKPNQIPAQLTGWQKKKDIAIYQKMAKHPVNLLVIDSGCDTEHKFFLDVKKNIKLYEPQELLIIRQRLKRKSLEKNDLGLHGTTVMGYLVPLLEPIPGWEVTVAKVYSSIYDVALEWFPDPSMYRKRSDLSRPQVISMTVVSIVRLLEYYQRFSKKSFSYRSFMKYRLKVKNAIDGLGVTVVCSTGNYDSSPFLDHIVLEAQIPGVITVGGVFHDHEDNLAASNYAHGFPEGYIDPNVKAVPHICGICGPRDDLILHAPVPNSLIQSGWQLSGGTSLATPQVAGVCALLLSICPALTPDQIKEILMRTADLPDRGKTAHDYSLKQISHTLPNGDKVSPGLVNIKRAVRTANALSFMLSQKGKGDLLVKTSVEIAKNFHGEKW